MIHLSRMFFLSLAFLTLVGVRPAKAAVLTECTVIDGISGRNGQKLSAKVVLKTGELVISGEGATIWDGTYQYSKEGSSVNSLFQEGSSTYRHNGTSVLLLKVPSKIDISYEAHLVIGHEKEDDPGVAEHFLLICRDSE